MAALVVSAKYVVQPERTEKNGVATHRFNSAEAPDAGKYEDVLRALVLEIADAVATITTTFGIFC
jgi:hypothetical protein